MGDEDESKDEAANKVPEDTPQPAPREIAGVVVAQSGLDAAADESASPDTVIPPSGGDPGVTGAKGGGIKRWSANHKMLTGIGIGVLAVLLIAGVFVIGYFVGKPCNEQERRVPGQRFQSQGPMQPDLRSAPSPGRGRAGQRRLDVLVEYRDELENAIAGELGISVDELQDEMVGGKTIAEIAEEKGVSTEDLTAAVAAEMGKIADKLAADGEITTEQAENIKSDAEIMASRFIERGYRQPPTPSE